MAETNLPNNQFIARHRNATQSWELKEGGNTENVGDELSVASTVEYSPDGKLIAVAVLDEGITVYETDTMAVKQKFDRKGIRALAFSPLNSYVVSWERPTEENKQEGNFIIWNVATGEVSLRWFQKAFDADTWPTTQWSEDEIICARLVTNEIQFYNGQNMSAGVLHKLRIPNVKQLHLAPGDHKPYVIASFTPEVKGAPASVTIHTYSPAGGVMNQLCSKSFYKAQRVDIKWNSKGTAILCMTHTETDSSDRSYYGETGLYFMATDGETCNVPLSKDGPIHDVQWSPTGREFVVIYGFMPAKSTLFNFQCKPTFEFGESPRNTVKWAPHGRFLLLGGFGNLQGHIDFWDRNKLKKMGSCHADCAVSHEWSPCSRYLLTGVLFPRLRVDNGWSLWTYYGEKIHTEPFKELYEVKFRRALPGIFPDRPQSPHVLQRAKQEAEKATEEKPKRQAYRHPNASKDTSWMFSRQEESAGKVSAGSSSLQAYAEKISGGKKFVPGMEIPETADQKLTKNQLKNLKRKEKKKHEAEKEEETKKIHEALAPMKIEEKKTIEALTPDEVQKKIKAVQKKLRQIEQLKEKQAAGQELEDTQKTKIAQESELSKELKELEARL